MGLLYKLLFEFSILTFPFFTYGWILAGWLSSHFLGDLYTLKLVENNSDYLQYDACRYRRALPGEPQRII
jgi:hypothetical protein